MQNFQYFIGVIMVSVTCHLAEITHRGFCQETDIVLSLS